MYTCTCTLYMYIYMQQNVVFQEHVIVNSYFLEYPMNYMYMYNLY